MWTGGEVLVYEGDLPADTLSVTLMATAPGADLLALGVSDPQGRVLVDALDPEGSINRLLRGRGTVLGAVPSSSAAWPLPSNLRVQPRRLDSPGSEGLTLTAWIKRSRGAPPAVQELPLSVLLVGRAGALGGPLDAALSVVRRIWSPAGIEVLDPARLPVEAPDRVAVDPALGSDTPAVGAALRLSERAPGTLALVIVAELALAGADFELWSLTGSIPVPPLAGTPRSGILVSSGFIARDPAFAGLVIAHEIGHALGLYHTTERALTAGAALHDQLDDTAACAAAADANRDGELDAGECRSYDGSNLMFAAPVRGGTTLTAGQATMARRSALVH